MLACVSVYIGVLACASVIVSVVECECECQCVSVRDDEEEEMLRWVFQWDGWPMELARKSE